MRKVYDSRFYDDQQTGSLNAARAILPLVLDVFAPKSVVDIGCGVGTWLRAARELGIETLDGYDGDYVDRSRLHIPAERFHAIDLAGEVGLQRRYDLAMSLEVAEHLPRHRAEPFVRLLTGASPVVLFSAAIPGQGGTDHVNEQWPDQWRARFAAHGYRCLDLVRPSIWGNPQVPFWYQQNVLVFAHTDVVEANGLRPVPEHVSLNVVHPALFARTIEQADMYLSKSLRMLPALVGQAVRRRLGQRPPTERS